MGKRIIVIEDEALIALDIEQAVTDAGCEVVGYGRTVKQGLELIETKGCDGAVLDANLNGESARPILERLKADDLPYVVVSGYSRDQLDFLDDATILVSKPFSMNELVSSIRQHLNETDTS